MGIGDACRAALRTRMVGNVLVLVVALGSSLVLLELGLRGAWLLRPAEERHRLPWEARDNEWAFYQYDSLLGWKNRPGASGWFSMPDSRTRVQINSRGLRDVEHGARDRRRPRILVLGDSFTWGFGVEQGERYTDWLARLLGPGVEVINAGVSGYGTDQELLYYRTDGFRYQPDVLLLEFELEDVMNNTHAVQYTYPKPYFTLEHATLSLRNVPVPTREAPWWQRYSLDRALPPPPTRWWTTKRFLRDHLLSYTFIVDGTRALLERYREPAIDNVEAVTAAVLLELKRETARHGAELVIMMLPSKDAVLEDAHQAWWDAYRAFFREHWFRYVDLRPLFRAATVRGQQLYFAVDAHWNREGHHTGALAVGAYLTAEGLAARGAGAAAPCRSRTSSAP